MVVTKNLDEIKKNQETANNSPSYPCAAVKKITNSKRPLYFANVTNKTVTYLEVLRSLIGL